LITSNKDFDGCNASSSIKDKGCLEGLSGKMLDEDGSIWATNSENVGAYLEFRLKKRYTIFSL
jgi:hypothetical protein